MIADGLTLLQVLRLASPALPIGAFGYSQGLEQAVDWGWVCDEASAGDWINGLLLHSLAHQDLPVLLRLMQAHAQGDHSTARYWNAWLQAGRDSRELQDEDRQMAQALARLLDDLGVAEAALWRHERHLALAGPFALAAVHWQIPAATALHVYAWMWCEAQSAAAARLVPLGQTAVQRLLGRCMPTIQAAASLAASLTDDQLGSSAPGLALAGIGHETLYSRLFRS